MFPSHVIVILLDPLSTIMCLPSWLYPEIRVAVVKLEAVVYTSCEGSADPLVPDDPLEPAAPEVPLEPELPVPEVPLEPEELVPATTAFNEFMDKFKVVNLIEFVPTAPPADCLA
jgi:hypothetical protein